MRNSIVESLRGVPVEEPLIASAQLILEPGVELAAIRRDVEELE